MSAWFDQLNTPDVWRSIFAAVVTALIGVLFRYLRPAARIRWGLSHGFAFTLTPPNAKPQTLYTQTIFVQNIGRAAASDVEVHLNFKPEHFQLWPSHSFAVETTPDNHFLIRLKNLGRNREWFTIEMVSGSALPAILRVRTADGEAPQVPMAPTQQFPRWFRNIFLALIVLGVFTAVRWALLLALH